MAALVTPLAAALIVVETTGVIFAVDSIPRSWRSPADTLVVYMGNVFALLCIRALYYLITGATVRFRYLRPGLAVILAAVAAKLLLAGLYTFPHWASPAFIAGILAMVAILSVRDAARRRPPGCRAGGLPLRRRWQPAPPAASGGLMGLIAAAGRVLHQPTTWAAPHFHRSRI